MKEDCILFGINNKGVREILMKNDGKLETFPFRGPLFIKTNPARENLLQNNHKNVSRPKDFNKNTDISNTDPP